MADRVIQDITGKPFVKLAYGEDPPRKGWSIRPDRAVFENGEQVGIEGSALTTGPHPHISYIPAGG